MIKPVKTVFFYLAGIALISFLGACGEPEPAKQPVKKQPVQKKKVKKQRKEYVDILERPAYIPQASTGDSTGTMERPQEEKQTAEVKSEVLQPISSSEAAARTQIRKNRRSTWKIQRSIPANSLAAQIKKNSNTAKNTSYVWTPQPVQGSLELFRIPDIQLSPDSSLLVFIETIGEAQGPFGTRLILMSTSSWQVLNILEFRDRFFKKIAFIPGTTKIAALCIAQEECNQKQGFACLDLLNGKEERFQQIEPGIGDTAFLVDKNQNLIVSHPQRSVLIVLPLNGKGHHEINVSDPNSLAVLSEDSNELAVLKPQHGKRIEIFRTADWLPAATVELTETTNAAKFHFARGDKAFFICGDPSYSSSSLLVRAGKTTELNEVSSGNAVFTDHGKKIHHLSDTGNRIHVIDGVSGAELRSLEIDKVQPGFKKAKPGKVTHLFYIPACDGLAMFDDRANLFLITAEPQKTEKGFQDERAIIFQGLSGN